MTITEEKLRDAVRNAIDLDVYGCSGSANETQVRNVTKRIAFILTQERQRGFDEGKELAAQHWPTIWHEATGYLVRCECGWKSQAFKEPDSNENVQTKWAEHIRALERKP